MRQKKAVTKELKDRYQRSSKKGKTHILNEFIQLTRYNRSYAARTLRIKEVLGYINIAGKRVKLVRDKRKTKRKKTNEVKVKLRKEYGMLNPAELKRKITKLQNRLIKLNSLKQREDLEKSMEPSSRFEYIST